MTVVDLYTIQIIRDDDLYQYDGSGIATRFAEIMAEAEENMSDLMPPNYRARIRRWDDNEGTDDE